MSINLSTLVNTTVPSQLATAWVYFNGSTGTIVNSYNVSSITKNSTGNYTVNFTTAFPNANYCAVASASNTYLGACVNASSFSTTGFVITIFANNSFFAAEDQSIVCAIVFGT